MAFFPLSTPKFIRSRIDDWFARHNPPSQGNIILYNRRLYILPTRFGYLFSVMLLLLFLAAINYQNSMGFVLTFMLTSLAIISLWQTHKNLLGLEIELKSPRAVYAGENCKFEFNVSHRNNNHRYAVGIQYGSEIPVYLNLESDSSEQAIIEIPTIRRGQFKPKGLIVFSRYPTGLYHCWAWLKFDSPILIYPRPMANVRLFDTLVEEQEGKTSTSTIEGDDFAGLREHREGESLRHISWKAYAQQKGLLTKTFEGHARPSLWIDWSALNEVSIEARLSHMTALVILAEKQNRIYGVKLPGTTIKQQVGEAHRKSCLQAITIYQQSDLNQDFEPDEKTG